MDPLAGHEVNEALERALELAIVCLAHVIEDLLRLFLGEDDLELLEHLLQALCGGQLVGHVLQLAVDDGVEGLVVALQRLLDLLIDII